MEGNIALQQIYFCLKKLPENELKPLVLQQFRGILLNSGHEVGWLVFYYGVHCQSVMVLCAALLGFEFGC
eukprot:5482336-Amphidinium_carterae.1